MSSRGVIFKRCGCRDQATGRRLEKDCPRLQERGHGTWYFHCSAKNLLGRSERIRRGGYPSKAAAQRARDEWLAESSEWCTAGAWTVERWLRYWLSTRSAIRPTTRLHYTRDVERVLIPHLGGLRLADLDGRRLRAVFAGIAATTNSKGQLQSVSALHHFRKTLRAALSLAVREGVIATNPVHRLELPPRPKPHPQVWTAQQLATFLGGVVEDPLFAFWWLAALRGLRRGEVCGLRWSEVDLDHGVLFVVRNRTTAGYQVVEGPPKTVAGLRAVALDRDTIRILREHRRRQAQQQAERLAAGKTCRDSGYVFTQPGGGPLHPGYVSARFRYLVRHSGLPPVRLHDLRHGAASLAHEAGADLKTLQELLGHSSIVVTADTYTSVLPPAQRRCADSTARLVLAAARRIRQKIKGKGHRNRAPKPGKKAHTATRTAPTAVNPQIRTPATDGEPVAPRHAVGAPT